MAIWAARPNTAPSDPADSLGVPLALRTRLAAGVPLSGSAWLHVRTSASQDSVSTGCLSPLVG
jgi:hypothetical protein